MGEERTKAMARVQLTIEVTAQCHWSSSAQVHQVYQQAADDVRGQLQVLFHNAGIKVVGEPHVVAVLAEEQ